MSEKVRVKLTQDHFSKDGVYHYAGEEIDHEGPLPHYMKEIGAAKGETSRKVEYTEEDLRKKLADYGVKTAPQAGMKRLLEQLAEAEGRTA